jgi:hypothetical protein
MPARLSPRSHGAASRLLRCEATVSPNIPDANRMISRHSLRRSGGVSINCSTNSSCSDSFLPPALGFTICSPPLACTGATPPCSLLSRPPRVPLYKKSKPASGRPPTGTRRSNSSLVKRPGRQVAKLKICSCVTCATLYSRLRLSRCSSRSVVASLRAVGFNPGRDCTCRSVLLSGYAPPFLEVDPGENHHPDNEEEG